MGDMREAFDALKEYSRDKRLSNKLKSTMILRSKGVEFHSKNNGSHLIVDSGDGLIDFWPSTGKYQIRKTKRFGRGVKNLLKELQTKG